MIFLVATLMGLMGGRLVSAIMKMTRLRTSTLWLTSAITGGKEEEE